MTPKTTVEFWDNLINPKNLYVLLQDEGQVVGAVKGGEDIKAKISTCIKEDLALDSLPTIEVEAIKYEYGLIFKVTAQYVENDEAYSRDFKLNFVTVY